MTENKLIRMDNVSIVVESLDNAIAFFTEIGLTLIGKTSVEGEWAGKITGLGYQNAEIAMMETPMVTAGLNFHAYYSTDYRRPSLSTCNSLGYQRIMFTVKDIDDMISRLRKYGTELVGEVVQYENSFRLCFIRGIEGILIGLAEEIG